MNQYPADVTRGTIPVRPTGVYFCLFYITFEEVCQDASPNIVRGDIGADGGTLNPYLAYGELVKLPSAPFGRYRLENLSLSCNLKRFLAPNDHFQQKSHPQGVAFLLELMAGLEPATC